MAVWLSPQVDLHEWASKYELDLAPISCPRCGTELNPQHPTATKGLRGLQFETCPNHDDVAPVLFRFADPNKDSSWRQTTSGLFEALEACDEGA